MRFSRIAAIGFAVTVVTVSVVIYDHPEFLAQLSPHDGSRVTIYCTDSPCPSGYSCVGETCIADDECDSDDDCGQDQRCWDGTCGPECYVDSDCAQPGQECNGGVCEGCDVAGTDCTEQDNCCNSAACTIIHFVDTNNDGEGDKAISQCGGVPDQSDGYDPIFCCNISYDNDPDTQQFMSYSCGATTTEFGCPDGQQYSDEASCLQICHGEVVGGDIGGGSDCWLPTCPAGFCFPDGNSAPDGSCNQGSYPTEAACVSASYDYCGEQGYSDISLGGYIPPQMTLGGGGGVGSGTGDSGSNGQGVAGDEDENICGKDTCMSADNCAFFDGVCGNSCSKGCCCASQQSGTTPTDSGTGDNDGDGVDDGSQDPNNSALTGSSPSSGDTLHGAANSSDAARGIGCSPSLTYDCPACPNGVTQRFFLTSTGFLATAFNGCAGNVECEKRNDEFFLEYRGGCQWSTNQDGDTCDSGDMPEWTMTVDAAPDDAQTITLFERGGGIYSGWTSFCQFPLGFSTIQPSQACDGSQSQLELFQSCLEPVYLSSDSSGSSQSRSSIRSNTSSRSSSSRTSGSSRVSSAGTQAAAKAGNANAVTQGPYCGDGSCNGTESPISCTVDCPSRCGDAICFPSENGTTCPQDCRCGDFLCSSNENGSTCPSDCQQRCGNGIIEGQEQCDDGIYNNSETPDGCRVNCQLPVCGDGVPDTDEACDDGNRTTDDACANDCLRGLGASCSDNEQCSSNLCVDGFCAEKDVCGNDIREGGEWCDDGNTDDADACTSQCLWNLDQPCALSEACASGICTDGVCKRAGICGDGVVDTHLDEQCDQGKANSNVIPNRCRKTCKTASRGDGVVDFGEQCDDNNTKNGDGCSAEGIHEQVAAEPTLIELPQIAQQLPAQVSTPFVADLLNGNQAGPQILGQLYVGAPQASLNDSGPAALVLMASGASAGYAFLRRRRR